VGYHNGRCAVQLSVKPLYECSRAPVQVIERFSSIGSRVHVEDLLTGDAGGR
jgi:hypothetical protein